MNFFYFRWPRNVAIHDVPQTRRIAKRPTVGIKDHLYDLHPH